MMYFSKKLFIYILTFLLLLVMSGCELPNKNNPKYQEMTKWTAENISMYIVDGWKGFIEFENGDGCCVLRFRFGRSNLIISDTISQLDSDGKEIFNEECWQLKKMKSDSFTADVQQTVYFKEGQKFKFKKVADNLDESELPYPYERENDSSEPQINLALSNTS